MSADTPFDPRSDDYGDLLSLARTLSIADTHLDAPPDDVWAGIEALVAAGPAPATVAARTTVTSPAAAAQVAPVLPLAAARRRRFPVLLGAAAAVVLAVVGLLAFVARDGSDDVALDEISLSNDGLAPEGVSARGRATLVEAGDGRYALDIDVADLPRSDDGFLELWIIDTNVKGMYSLGPLHGSGRYVLPDHVDPASFPIVDVSIEPSDGAPEHSGKSILRGTLTI